MKTITASDFNLRVKDYLQLAQSEEIVIRLDSGNLLWLSHVKQEDLADEIMERDPRFYEVLAKREVHYQTQGGIQFDAVRDALIVELNEELHDANPRIREEAAQYLVALQSDSNSSISAEKKA